MDSQQWSPRINYSLCNGCGECLQKCPCSVFRVEHSKPVIYDPLGCNYCGLCEAICPTAAIELPYLVCRATDQFMLQERSKVTVNHQKNPYTSVDSLIAQLDLIPADSIISRTIVTDRHFKAVLSGFAAGQSWPEHSVAQSAVIQIVSGQAIITLGNHVYEVDDGAWIYVPPQLPHSITALTPVIILLLLIENPDRPSPA